jgi:hypothetical protein
MLIFGRASSAWFKSGKRERSLTAVCEGHPTADYTVFTVQNVTSGRFTSLYAILPLKLSAQRYELTLNVSSHKWY